mmetsp:Transcript_2087/g.5213  ORF Transcript_2087/g.5213 Transcript_2087/m.5213 type:complete len:237 (-) Transcript_2087:1239-1949(-)
MPAPRAASTDSGTPSRSGSMEATRPTRRMFWRQAENLASVLRSSSLVLKGMLVKVRVAIASTRRARSEYLSTTLMISALAASVMGATLPSAMSCSVQYSAMKFGAPLHTTKCLVPAGKDMPPGHSSLRPATLATVSIILREEEKGISNSRGYSLATSSEKPTLRAATMIGASEELPLGSHFSSPVSGSLTFDRVVLQQSTADRRADFTLSSCVASAPVFAFLILPTVGSKPFPSTV